MRNRLDLNFKLETQEERTQYVQVYLQEPCFRTNPPTPDELETIGNYILWGKSTKTGLSVVDEKLVEIETRNKTWTKPVPESLEGLLAEPTFSETSLRPLSAPQPKSQRNVFNRADALERAPSYIRQDLEALFQQIDYLDLCIGFYEFQCGRRAEPPREQLRRKFSEEELQKAIGKVQGWNQYKYLKCRHLLVELRRQQFTMRDSYCAPLQSRTTQAVESAPSTLDIEVEVQVFPLGTFGARGILKELFRPFKTLVPKLTSTQAIKYGTHLYWEKRDLKRTLAPVETLEGPAPQTFSTAQTTLQPQTLMPTYSSAGIPLYTLKNVDGAHPKFYFDFENLEHVYALLIQLFDIEDGAALPTSNLGELLETLKFYISQAQLSDSQNEILDLKIHHIKNEEIREYINKKYNKNYTNNYISTIFRQKIIPKINEAAAMHARIVSSLSIEEDFKQCTMCGQTYLRTPDYFVRKARAKDGLSSRCKICDKLERQRKEAILREQEVQYI